MTFTPRGLFAFAALTFTAAIVAAVPARAQAFPPGSYQQSCTQVHWAGSTLVAECRRADGRMTGTGLPDAGRCTGGIANVNGQLTCGAGGPPAAARGPGREEPRQGFNPGYGPGPQEPRPEFRPGYGAAGDYGDRRAHCEELAQREGWLRGRLQAEPYGPERERFEYRLRETHEDRERTGCFR